MAVPERLIGYDFIQVKSPYELQTLHEVQITAKANDHATLRFTGIVPDEKKDSCVYSATSQDKVEVLQVVNGSVEQIFFKGKVQSLSVKAVNGIYYLEVLAVSHTIDLDLKYQNRSFHNNKMTYTQMIKEVIADCDGDAIIDRKVESKTLGQFILQYHETNWAFLKRMASRFGLTLFPDVTADKPKFWFGLPEGKAAVTLEDFHYAVKKNISDYLETAWNYDGTLTESDFISYELESNRALPIGARVKCKESEFVIARSVTAIKGGGLKHL
ncbi:MAG TPA: contractile injection system protein, VgrG/Pvc8 family, partial [Bacillota bacterium]|nr:contractile injection system protein, VgrG/Pvc8 family [Bacillota bacterium]